MEDVEYESNQCAFFRCGNNDGLCVIREAQTECCESACGDFEAAG